MDGTLEDLIGVGIIGTGVGVRTLLPGFRRTGRARIVALSGSSEARTAEVGSALEIPRLTGDFRSVCEAPEVDLICVASPNEFHLEHASFALSTDKHVYIEKPTGVDAVEARAVAAAANSKARLVVVGHQLRFNPYLRRMRDMIASGTIGRIYHLAIAQCGSGFTDVNRKWTWEFDASRGGGVRLAMGSHLVDLANFLLDQTPSAVAAALDPVHLTRTPEGGEARECHAANYFSALLTYPATTAHVSTTAAAHGVPRFDVVAYGDLADLTFDLDRKLLLHRFGEAAQVAVDKAVDAEYADRQASSIFSTSFTYLADEIVNAILRGGIEIAGAATLEEAARYMIALDAARESHTAGSRVLLRPWESKPYS